VTLGCGCGEPRRIAAAILLRSDWVAGTRAVTSWLGPEEQEPEPSPGDRPPMPWLNRFAG
jgi:hypothetical protein